MIVPLVCIGSALILVGIIFAGIFLADGDAVGSIGCPDADYRSYRR